MLQPLSLPPSLHLPPSPFLPEACCDTLKTNLKDIALVKLVLRVFRMAYEFLKQAADRQYKPQGSSGWLWPRFSLLSPQENHHFFRNGAEKGKLLEESENLLKGAEICIFPHLFHEGFFADFLWTSPTRWECQGDSLVFNPGYNVWTPSHTTTVSENSVSQ